MWNLFSRTEKKGGQTVNCISLQLPLKIYKSQVKSSQREEEEASFTPITYHISTVFLKAEYKDVLPLPSITVNYIIDRQTTHPQRDAKTHLERFSEKIA